MDGPPPPERPRRNRYGREIWFELRDGVHDLGGYAPVHRNGWLVIVIGAMWIVVGGRFAYSLMAGPQHVGAALAILVVAVPLLPTIWLVYRHS